MEVTLDQALQKGIEAHKAGQVQEADRIYTAILKADPKHPDANHNMGVLAVDVGKLEAALPFFKTALEANSSIAQYWLSNIDALIKLGRVADAKALFDQAKSNGMKGDAFGKLEQQMAGRGKDQEPTQKQVQPLIDLYSQGLHQESINLAAQLLGQFPNSINLYNIMGAANQSLGNLEEAIEAYKKAISLKPDYAEAYNNMGVTLNEQSKLDEALEAYKRAISLKPDYAEAYNNMGNTLQRKGKLDDALEAYNKAITLTPHHAKAYYNMGLCLRDQGKLEEAIEAYNTALSINPDYAEAYSNIGVSLRDQGKLEEAIEAYNKALSINPDFAEAYSNMGNVLTEQGKLDEALRFYTKALKIKPDYADAYYNTGGILRQQGKLEEAVQAYTKAVSIKPDYASAKHMLSALTGNTNETAPREYVENLFDGYSKKFEASLVDMLEYKIPKLIRDILIQPNSNESLGSVLDLGCGTGLLGPEIRNQCSRLEGIDLSHAMLELAKQKNVYDKLNHSDIVEYLSNFALGFDYYIALDVFIYVGELAEIFRLIKSRNKKPGKLVFSTEHTELDGFHLLKTGRYSHSKSYIEGLCKKFDYNIDHFATTNLRKEKDDFLTGAIYVVSFTTK